jgi:hypothetical protein
LLACLGVLEEFGPQLGRPNVDTLKGSSHSNMKELRFSLDGLWRFAFAFDPLRQDKEGANQSRFYKELIKIADERFASHIASLKATKRK